MAGNDILKALAVLAESGIELTQEQETALAEFKSSAMREAATKVLVGKMDTPDKGEAEDMGADWTSEMFALAANVSEWVKGSNVGRGRGEVHEKMFRIETPDGSLKVSLTTEPVAE